MPQHPWNKDVGRNRHAGTILAKGVSRATVFPENRRFEVLVFGRRGHARFTIGRSARGELRVLRDVIVQHVDENEFLVIGREAAATGAVLTLEIAELDAGAPIGVRVLESYPVAVDGTMRHRLRLQRIRPVREGAR